MWVAGFSRKRKKTVKYSKILWALLKTAKKEEQAALVSEAWMSPHQMTGVLKS